VTQIIAQQSNPLLIVAHGFGCLAGVQAASDYSERIAGAMLVALPDPDNYRVTSLLPKTPLAFPTVVVSSTNDPRMRSDKSAFWAGFWSASFVSIGAAGSIDEDSGFGPWPQARDPRSAQERPACPRGRGRKGHQPGDARRVRPS
jgi:hypothetical protein